MQLYSFCSVVAALVKQSCLTLGSAAFVQVCVIVRIYVKNVLTERHVLQLS